MSGFLRKLFVGLIAAGLVTFVLSPFTSALIGAVTIDLAPIVDVLLVLFSAPVAFGSTATIVLKRSTSRAALGRGLACLGTALIIFPVGLSVLFALYLRDWVSNVTDTAIEQAGITTASVFGGFFMANAIAIGLALGFLFLLLGCRLMQVRPVPFVSP